MNFRETINLKASPTVSVWNLFSHFKITCLLFFSYLQIVLFLIQTYWQTLVYELFCFYSNEVLCGELISYLLLSAWFLPKHYNFYRDLTNFLFFILLLKMYASKYLKIDVIFWLKPMQPEQVLSERDSEDEVDDDVADFEDRRVCLMISSRMQLFLLFKQQCSGCT